MLEYAYVKSNATLTTYFSSPLLLGVSNNKLGFSVNLVHRADLQLCGFAFSLRVFYAESLGRALTATFFLYNCLLKCSGGRLFSIRFNSFASAIID